MALPCRGSEGMPAAMSAFVQVTRRLHTPGAMVVRNEACGGNENENGCALCVELHCAEVGPPLPPPPGRAVLPNGGVDDDDPAGPARARAPLMLAVCQTSTGMTAVWDGGKPFPFDLPPGDELRVSSSKDVLVWATKRA